MSEIAIFLLITFAWTWSFFSAVQFSSNGHYSEAPLGVWPIILGAFGPSVAAFDITIRKHGGNGAWQFLKRGFQLRFSALVYAFLIIVPTAIVAIANSLTGGGIPSLSPSILGIFVLIFFLGGSFGEEFGWRGFLFPKLTEKYRPIAAAVILGIVWAIWHLPLFWISGTSQFTTPFWLYLIYILALSVQYAWVYLRTDGNLFACLLLHTFTNITITLFPLQGSFEFERFAIESGLNVLVAVVLILIDRDRFVTANH
jgi:membrane protease YdiL (CAAX protease family)